MKQESDNNYNNNFDNDILSNWGNSYNNSTSNSQSTPNQYGNSYNNTPPNQYSPNQYNNAYSNNAMPNQYGNAYGNNAIPNQYGNTYGNNPMSGQYYNGMPQFNGEQYQPPKKKKKIWLIILLAVVLPIVLISGCTAAIFGIVFAALDEVKDSEEYKLAYSYVVESEFFDKLDVDESEIKFTGYHTTVSAGSAHSSKKSFDFTVDGCSLTVVCHQASQEEWIVCDECTKFE